jgi:ubiquinol-cytochrome c reductase core subunit 2
MISRALLGRRAQLSLQRQCSVTPASRRGLAAPASGSFSYETGSAAGVKFASRDLAGPTTTLAVVAKAGTRYQVLPGFADGLQKFAFKVSHGVCWSSREWLLRLHNRLPIEDLL